MSYTTKLITEEAFNDYLSNHGHGKSVLRCVELLVREFGIGVPLAHKYAQKWMTHQNETTSPNSCSWDDLGVEEDWEAAVETQNIKDSFSAALRNR